MKKQSINKKEIINDYVGRLSMYQFKLGHAQINKFKKQEIEANKEIEELIKDFKIWTANNNVLHDAKTRNFLTSLFRKEGINMNFSIEIMGY